MTAVQEFMLYAMTALGISTVLFVIAAVVVTITDGFADKDADR